MKKHYEHDAVSEPTIILEAKFPVFEGEESVVEVLSHGDTIICGDFEILFSDAGNGKQADSTFEYVGFTSSGIWEAKASESIPGYLISVVFLSPSRMFEEEAKGTKLKIGEVTFRQKITSYTSTYGTYACATGSSWSDCNQGLLSATVRQMANWGLRTYVPTGTASVVNSYSRSAPSGGLEPGLVSSLRQMKMYSAIGQSDLVNAYPITSEGTSTSIFTYVVSSSPSTSDVVTQPSSCSSSAASSNAFTITVSSTGCDIVVDETHTGHGNFSITTTSGSMSSTTSLNVYYPIDSEIVVTDAVLTRSVTIKNKYD